MSATHAPGISSGAIEGLKWLAFAGMLVDHVNGAFYGYALGPWADAIGRPVLPIFAGVFAYNLARAGQDAAAIARRLLLPAAIAAPAHAALFYPGHAWLPLNVLATLAAGAALLALHDRGHRAASWITAALVGFVLEYMHAGLAIIAAGVMHARRPSSSSSLALALAVLALCVFNGNAWALLALPLAALVVQGGPQIPRTGRWLLWLYPAHLSALWAFRSLTVA